MDAQEITKKITENLSNKLDDILIKGLELKGYTFGNRFELENFIKENCTCADYLPKQEKTFYVKGVPFLLYNYEIKINPMVKGLNEISVNADYGSYSYI